MCETANKMSPNVYRVSVQGILPLPTPEGFTPGEALSPPAHMVIFAFDDNGYSDRKLCHRLKNIEKTEFIC